MDWTSGENGRGLRGELMRLEWRVEGDEEDRD